MSLQNLTLEKLRTQIPDDVLNELAEIKPEHLYILKVFKSGPPQGTIGYFPTKGFIDLAFICRDKNYFDSILHIPNFIRFIVSQKFYFPDNLLIPEIMYILSLKSHDLRHEMNRNFDLDIIDSLGQYIDRFNVSDCLKKYEHLPVPKYTDLEIQLLEQNPIPPERVEKFFTFLKKWPYNDVIEIKNGYKFKNPEITSISQLFLSKLQN